MAYKREAFRHLNFLGEFIGNLKGCYKVMRPHSSCSEFLCVISERSERMNVHSLSVIYEKYLKSVIVYNVEED